ncbi:MAG TPA: hypothetical protein PLJ30_06295 [Deltaproteobacteria bacterium]|nr:hypothetical protein [Deltaproteobacteria bacterium]
MKRWIIIAAVIIVAIGAFVVADTCIFQKKEEPVIPGETSYPIDRQAREPEADLSEQTGQRPVIITEIPVSREERDRSFDEVKAELAQVCRELESKDYIKVYKIEGGLHARLDAMIEKLAYRPPVVSGETKDLYSLLSNAAHFYRVLGREDILLLKDILSHERDRIEPLMSLLFQYLIKGSSEHKLNVNIGQLYEYAGFFLNTLGGQSYLYRRDSVTRTLTKYYSVLILDMADKEKMNPYGIDIRPHLTLIQEDMRILGGLKNSDIYQARLKEIEASIIR